MTRFKSKQLYLSALLQNGWRPVLFLFLVSLLPLVTSCSDDDDKGNMPMLKGKISSYNEFGAAMLDFTEADMTNAGFTLGDIISITVDGKEIVMPYYDGYYTRNGEYLCVAYPTYPSICFTANNVGLPKELTGLEGYDVVVKMKEKGGKADVQQALSMKSFGISLCTRTTGRGRFFSASKAMAASRMTPIAAAETPMMSWK